MNLLRKIWCFLFHRNIYVIVKTRWWYGHLAGALFKCPKCNHEFYHSKINIDYGWHFSPTKDSSLQWEENEV